MSRHLEAVALAVANADPRFILPTIRQAYREGASIAQVLGAIEMGHCLADITPAIARAAWDAAHTRAFLARRAH